MKTMLLAAALAACLPYAPAAADPVPSVVRYADLDLASDDGVAKLDRRIRSAVESACGSRSNYDLRGTNAVRRCRALARKNVAVQRSRAIAVSRRSASIAPAAGL